MEQTSAWIAHPDIITAAIRALVWVAAVVGFVLSGLFTALIGTFIYIWREAKVKVDSIDIKVDRIATGLEGLTLSTSTQIAEIKTRCKELHTPRREDKGLSARHNDSGI